MAPLKNHERAIMDARKVVEYLMDPRNEDSREKWRAFDALGFQVWSNAGRVHAATVLADELRAALGEAEATFLKHSPHGPRYETRTLLTGPNGRAGTFVAIWQYDDEGEVPRLITGWLRVHRREVQA